MQRRSRSWAWKSHYTSDTPASSSSYKEGNNLPIGQLSSREYVFIQRKPKIAPSHSLVRCYTKVLLFFCYFSVTLQIGVNWSKVSCCNCNWMNFYGLSEGQMCNFDVELLWQLALKKSLDWLTNLLRSAHNDLQSFFISNSLCEIINIFTSLLILT